MCLHVRVWWIHESKFNLALLNLVKINPKTYHPLRPMLLSRSIFLISLFATVSTSLRPLVWSAWPFCSQHQDLLHYSLDVSQNLAISHYAGCAPLAPSSKRGSRDGSSLWSAVIAGLSPTYLRDLRYIILSVLGRRSLRSYWAGLAHRSVWS